MNRLPPIALANMREDVSGYGCRQISPIGRRHRIPKSGPGV
jgi:hypothetical protein